jgi:hypothetical protein
MQSDEKKLREWLLLHCGPPALTKLRQQVPRLINWDLLDEQREQLGKLVSLAMQRRPA